MDHVLFFKKKKEKKKEHNHRGIQEKTVINSHVVTILRKLLCHSFHKVLFLELNMQQTDRTATF